jgi:hypothetical protein
MPDTSHTVRKSPLTRAAAKLKLCDATKHIYGGYMRATDATALLQAGAKHSGTAFMYDHMETRRKKENCNTQTWLYFFVLPGTELARVVASILNSRRPR